eukprot:GAHX01000553.1.p1 GENE.GAHX01000553.1~~GAHX01000553.1.p1  ORF type:complete len:763 (-),score=188.79 GAHX01000553.1:26-2314(-)
MNTFRQQDRANILGNNGVDVYTLKQYSSSLTKSKFSFSPSYEDSPSSVSIQGNLVDFAASQSNSNIIHLLTNSTNDGAYSVSLFDTKTNSSSVLLTLPVDQYSPNSLNNISYNNNNNILLSGKQFTILSITNKESLFKYPKQQTDNTKYNFIDPKSNTKVVTVFSSLNTIDNTIYVFDTRKEAPIFTIPVEVETTKEYYGHFWNIYEGTQLFIFTKKGMKVVDLRSLNKPILTLNTNIIDSVVLNSANNNGDIKYLFLTNEKRILFYNKKLQDLGSIDIDIHNSSTEDEKLSFVCGGDISSVKIQCGDRIEGIDINYKKKVRVNNNINENNVRKLCLKKGKEEQNKGSELGTEIKELIEKYKEGKLQSFFDSYKVKDTNGTDTNNENNISAATDVDTSNKEDLETSFFDSIATTEITPNNTNTNNNTNENKTLESDIALLLLEKDFTSLIGLVKDTINSNKQITEEEKYKLKSLVYFVYYLTIQQTNSNKEVISFDKYYLECYLKEQLKETTSYLIANLISHYIDNKKEKLILLLEPTKNNHLRIYNVIKKNNIEFGGINSMIDKMVFIDPVFSVAITLSMNHECFVELIKKLQLKRRIKIEIVNLYNNKYNTKKSEDDTNVLINAINKEDSKDAFEDVTEKFTSSNEKDNEDNIQNNIGKVKETRKVDGLIQLDISKDKLNNNDIKKLSIATKKIYELKLDKLENELLNKLNDFIELVNDKNIKEADKVRTEIVKAYWKKHKGWLINLVTIMSILKKATSK